MVRPELSDLEPTCTPTAALAFFDTLAPVPPVDLVGRWRGRELRTGHPWTGRLEASGWYGKQVDDVDHVHPLLFATPGGRIFPLDPRLVPLPLVGRVPPALLRRGRHTLGVLRPVVGTRSHRARLRELTHHGVATAAMVYDDLPIIDVLRRVDDDTVLGLMDLRNDPRPFFFVLRREPLTP